MNRPASPPPPVGARLDPPADASHAFQGRLQDRLQDRLQYRFHGRIEDEDPRPVASKPPLARRFPRSMVRTQTIACKGQRGQTGGRSGHALFRDPGVGSIGAYGSTMQKGADDGRRLKLGLQGELYSGRFTLGGLAGANAPARPPSSANPIASRKRKAAC